MGVPAVSCDSGPVIDIGRVKGGADADWEARRTEIWAAWRDAGIVVLDDQARQSDTVMGVPSQAIWGRLRGGAGGGVAQEAVQIFLNLWPLAAAGYVGAVSADAWSLTKKGLAAGLKRLLGRTASEVVIEVADEGSASRDDTYAFETKDVADVDRALAAMVDNVVARAAVEERTTIEYTWDGAAGEWVPQSRTTSVRRVSLEGPRAPE
jgi:hypothetical protein